MSFVERLTDGSVRSDRIAGDQSPSAADSLPQNRDLPVLKEFGAAMACRRVPPVSAHASDRQTGSATASAGAGSAQCAGVSLLPPASTTPHANCSM